MAHRSSTRAPKLSRRRFVELLAAGSVAALAAPAATLAAGAAAAKPAPPKPRPAGAPVGAVAPAEALRIEVEKQKKSLADQLKVIRDYHLPPGSNMAFVFQPVRRKSRTP
jgi:hypothetical protein